ncbi:hypothetical protein FZI85_19315 [Mycobacterium sp. CBMA293]|uniref:MmpS family transport accessory protein n=1 Tax=unclassified Mycolicibacterium TaxID=2636767 RepID=UPI0012DCD841|nr:MULTISPECIES: MmpS family transport accessory protein [unclassified Mycolicibacterium]MUL48669.1 hypothetical protein [Mycolicibacterium sp. CBMA 360]MUL60833.1 hypothetical protein [Mycolicibacterium sp. CBMA 335]MUL71846.1 hypothetical protein [Mycolicibacterium sp. CBMA 311]MUL95774.1 hypothetical protein [Mycolicibacterium sp. CBMA 230]MUM06372.1 hypothetical protein [Mycolicibacterium sp. CBMA 213]
MTGSQRDGLDPTQKLPLIPPSGYPTGAFPDPYGAPTQPLPRPHRWLWPVAGAVAVLVLCLVIALVIVNSNEQQTLVAPPPLPVPTQDTMPTSTTATTMPTTSDSAEPSEAVSPPLTTSPTDGNDSGDTQAVLYSVIGSGRAVSITYVDSGGVLQTEFNVPLPWTKEVQLARPAARSASVTIVNAGRGIACTIAVDGDQIQQREGVGVTVCRSSGKRGRGHGH